MPTTLDKTIRRQIEIDGEEFTITISPHGVRLTKKRFRSGVALSWKALWTRHTPRTAALDADREPEGR